MNREWFSPNDSEQCCSLFRPITNATRLCYTFFRIYCDSSTTPSTNLTNWIPMTIFLRHRKIFIKSPSFCLDPNTIVTNQLNRWFSRWQIQPLIVYRFPSISIDRVSKSREFPWTFVLCDFDRQWSGLLRWFTIMAEISPSPQANSDSEIDTCVQTFLDLAEMYMTPEPKKSSHISGSFSHGWTGESESESESDEDRSWTLDRELFRNPTPAPPVRGSVRQVLSLAIN